MSEFIGITEAAEALGIRPKALSDLLYRRPQDLDLRQFPRIGARRVVRRSYLPRLKRLLDERCAVAATV